jgi:hypothetical protein
MSPSRKRRAKSLTIRKLFSGVVDGFFFAGAGSLMPASAGNLIIKLWKWFRGDRLESVLAK